MKQYVASIYTDRFDASVDERKVLWEILCKNFFQRFVKKSDTVLDLAAGYCEFINNIECKNKIAVDLNENTKQMANKDVKVYKALSTKLPKDLAGKVDVIFTSNFFEHLDNPSELMETLAEARRILKKGGSIMVLQPNIKLVGNQYWDYVDHTLPMTEKSLAEALGLNGFKVTYQKTRFLPYTANSRIPIVPLFIKIYLRFPPAQFFMGKQTFMVAEKA